MPRVLITGAAGFIGMHTSIRFLKEGWDVIGLDNMNSYYSVQLKEDRINQIKLAAKESEKSFKLFIDDINSDVWNKLCTKDIEIVIHLAAQAGVRYSIENPRAYLESNIIGFQSVIDFVISLENDVKFIYASSSSVYGKSASQPFTETADCNSPESYYAATKKANELMASSYYKTSKLSSVGLRFFTVYGPWGRPDMAPMLFAKAAMNNDTIEVFNHGRQKRDFTYIGDIVEGVFQVAIKPGLEGDLVLNIGNGKPTNLLTFISKLEHLFNKNILKNFVAAQTGDVDVTYADMQNFNRIIGMNTVTDIDIGLERFVEWYKSYYL
jgi:UDP-glucuronate 4-epimerase